MVEEKLQQRQVVRPQVAAEEEVAAESAVEVLDHRTGAGCAFGQFSDGHADGKEPMAESLAQRGLAQPTFGMIQVEDFVVERLTQRGDRKLKLDGQFRQGLVELFREGQQLIALVAQGADDWANVVRMKRLAASQFRDNKIEQLAAHAMIGTGERENIVA